MAGDNRDVSAALDDATKQGAARWTGVVARAENDEHTTTGNLSDRLDGQREPLRRIGSIDENAEGLATFEALHATRNAVHGFQAADNRFQVEARGQARGSGGQAIGDMWVPDDARANGGSFVAGAGEEGLFAG